MKKTLSLILAVMLLVFCLTGCGNSSAQTSEQTGQGSAAEASNESDKSAEPAVSGGEAVLRFGMIADCTSPFGLDAVNGIKAWVDHVNEEGGLQVGGEAYTLEGIYYDSTGDQVAANSAAERLIFEDGVDYIVSDNTMVDSWLHIAEENETVALITTNNTLCFNPEWHYIYETGAKNCSTATYTQWFVEHYEFKTIMLAHPDSSTGESDAEAIRMMINIFAPDAEVELISYPADSSDLSSLGTKVAASNPDVYMVSGGGPILDCQAVSVARQAGYTGSVLMHGTVCYDQLCEFLTPEELEGIVVGANPVEFDPGVTEFAEEYRQAYISAYGEWNNPEVACSHAFYALLAAVQEAGSIDKDAVREVLDNGLAYEGPLGPSVMVSRPDQGNDRTVDSVCGFVVKTVVNGERQIAEDGEISIEDAVEAFNIYLDYLQSQG